MIRQFLLFATLFFSLRMSGQTGIGTTTPHASAKLDVTATDKGFLPPRVTLTSSTDATTIPSPATGLLVYNTGNNAGLRAGYYYWNGTDWTTIATPTSAETVDYVSVMLTTDQSNFTIGQNVKFQAIQSGNIPYDVNTGNFSLTARKTYRLTALASLNGSSPAGSSLDIIWRSADGTNLSSLGSLITASSNSNFSGQGVVDCIFTPSVNTTVSLYITWVSSSNTVLRAYSTNATITQIGSSSIINPWVLSGTNTYNTTGNVGIGTSSPTSRLNIAGGGIKIHNGFTNNTARPSLTTTSIGSYEIRGVGSIEGSAQVDAGNDGFLRLSAGGGTHTTTQSSIDLSGFSSQADMNNNIVMRTAGTERLRIDNSGNVNVTGKLNVTDPSGSVSTKLVARFTAGTFVSFDNLRFSVTTDGPRGLSIATVSGTVNLYVEGSFNNGGIAGTRTASPVAYTTTPSGSPFGWGFGSSGDTIIYHLTDADNGRLYRVTLIIMPSYINNFICIERLL